LGLVTELRLVTRVEVLASTGELVEPLIRFDLTVLYAFVEEDVAVGKGFFQVIDDGFVGA